MRTDNGSQFFRIDATGSSRGWTLHEMGLQLRARRPRILVVEDNAAVLTLTCALVERVAAEIYTASNGEEAVARFAALRPDLVLMDICMPGMNGQTAASLMRRQETFARARTPVIAMTAAAIDDVHPGAHHPDFDGCLIKPFTRQHLYEMLMMWSPVPDAARDASILQLAARREHEAAPSHAPPTDRMRELVADLGLSMTRQITTAFVAEMEEALPLANQALLELDWTRLRERVHFMLGGAANLGLEALVSACVEAISKLDSDASAERASVREITAIWAVYRSILGEWLDPRHACTG